MLEKTLDSPLDSKEIKSVNPKGNQPWIFIKRIDAEAEAPKLWPTDVKNWLIGKDWCWERLKTEGGDRGWDGWMASPTQWTRTWASSGGYWRTGKATVLQSMGSQSRTRLKDRTTTTQSPWSVASHCPHTLARKMLFQFFRKEMQAWRGWALTWGHSAHDRIRN